MKKTNRELLANLPPERKEKILAGAARMNAQRKEAKEKRRVLSPVEMTELIFDPKAAEIVHARASRINQMRDLVHEGKTTGRNIDVDLRALEEKHKEETARENEFLKQMESTQKEAGDE